jgi:hypothetical protein
MPISKKSTRVFKVKDFQKIVFPPTTTLKLKELMLKLLNILRNEFQHHNLKFFMVSLEAFNLLIQESYDSMNIASKLVPHTQTDRGTCPGVGL